MLEAEAVVVVAAAVVVAVVVVGMQGTRCGGPRPTRGDRFNNLLDDFLVAVDGVAASSRNFLL